MVIFSYHNKQAKDTIHTESKIPQNERLFDSWPLNAAHLTVPIDRVHATQLAKPMLRNSLVINPKKNRSVLKKNKSIDIIALDSVQCIE